MDVVLQLLATAVALAATAYARRTLKALEGDTSATLEIIAASLRRLEKQFAAHGAFTEALEADLRSYGFMLPRVSALQAARAATEEG